MRADRHGAIEAEVAAGFDPSSVRVAGSDSGRTAMPSPGPADQDDTSFFQLPEFSSQDREIEEADEGPPTLVRGIIRGLGGFIWVIVLIAFTLARNCGGN